MQNFHTLAPTNKNSKAITHTCFNNQKQQGYHTHLL